MRLYFPELEPWVPRSASLPTVRPGLSVCECGASGCYPPLCQPVLHHSESGPLGLSVRECGTGRGLLVVRLPASFVPHSSNLGPTTATRVLSAPVPVSTPLPVRMYVSFLSTWCWTSLPFDFPSVLVVRGGAVCLPTPPSCFWVLFFKWTVSLVDLLIFFLLETCFQCSYSGKEIATLCLFLHQP